MNMKAIVEKMNEDRFTTSEIESIQVRELCMPPLEERSEIAKRFSWHVPMVGIVFGSFNPPHLGHVNLIEAAKKICDFVCIVPAAHNPMKEKAPLSMLDRYMMLKNIYGETSRNGAWIDSRTWISFHEMYMSECEKGPVYTDESLKFLTKKLLPSASKICVVIVTTDETFREMHNWHNGEEILKTWPMIVFNFSDKSGFKVKEVFDPAERMAPIGTPFRVFAEIPYMNMHSTQIREMISKGEDPLGFAPGVFAYAKEKGLYK